MQLVQPPQRYTHTWTSSTLPGVAWTQIRPSLTIGSSSILCSISDTVSSSVSASKRARPEKSISAAGVGRDIQAREVYIRNQKGYQNPKRAPSCVYFVRLNSCSNRVVQRVPYRCLLPTAGCCSVFARSQTAHPAKKKARLIHSGNAFHGYTSIDLSRMLCTRKGATDA